ncbi:hypothetical protein [Mesorhizobium sp. M0965]|uniref:hypothetical protein n=1 Tax=Mesorhizobium sp. M0965 TaxID=2957036 RepID=UPI00333CD52D
MAEPSFTADRSMVVPPGHIVETGYVPVEDVILACRERMAIGDVNTAYQKRLQLGACQSWPPPRGHWQGNRFVLVDGRHEFIAALMLGQSHLLVAWQKEAAHG